jgi:hypothetical protein
MAEESSDLPAFRKSLLTIVREWAAATVTVMLCLGGFAGFVLSTAHAQTAETVQAIRADAGRAQADAIAVRDELREHEETSRRIHAELGADMHELQLDIRALYRRIETGQPQPRLEHPLPNDGGAP